MLLRPATPLSIILIIAFVLLLLSTLSTPIIKAIPLSVDEGWAFGVFGYCRTDGTNCISPHIGYSTDALFSSGDSGDFSLSSPSRNTLSYILIVHPIAALLTLICAILALAAHFHAPSSSARYLLALLILTIPTLLASLLAFLVDILLFVPHMQWGGWIVLAATVLIVASSVLTCAMRRTLVSRKARTKRIAENEDMNGSTYYNSFNQPRMMEDPLPKADSPPPIPRYGSDKEGSQYASFEMKNHDSATRTSEDRAPLNPREGSIRSTSTGMGTRRPYGPTDEHPPMPGGQYTRDDYAAPVSPISPENGPPMLRQSNSRGSLTSQGSGRGGAYGRGRGYGPPQRGFGAPRGGYGPQRGYGPPRGGYNPRGSYRGAPPGYRGGMQRGGAPGYGQSGMPRGPPSSYGSDTQRGYAPDPYYSRDTPSSLGRDDQYRSSSPGPGVGIGQAIEMDERTGSPPGLYSNNLGHAQSTSPVRDGYDNAYIPPRSDWKATAPSRFSPDTMSHPSRFSPDSTSHPSRFSPDNTSHPSRFSPEPLTQQRGLSPIQASPSSDAMAGAHHVRTGSEDYYEDVDPRFAEPTLDQHMHSTAVPSSLMPGSAYNTSAPRMQPQIPDSNLLQPPPSRHLHSSSAKTDLSNSNSSLEDQPVQSATRSPDGSEASHFTSISQRPVNPHWRPGYSGGGQGSSAVAAQRRKEDIILNGNPDFSLPGIAQRGRGRGGSTSNIVTTGLTPQGRYPTEL